MYSFNALRVKIARTTLFTAAAMVFHPVTISAAQSINMEQLRRVLAGETFPEPEAEESAEAIGDCDIEFTENFFSEECRFVPRGDNRFWLLKPGIRLYLAGVDPEEEELVELYITVLARTRVFVLEINGQIQRVRTRIIEEREYIDGELAEISLNYFARCLQTNDVYYFGEDVCFFEDGECVDDSGSWLAGENGAVPGIIMPGTFFLGAAYFQEQAPGVALDRAVNAEMDLTLSVPYGTLEGCVSVHEDSALEPDAESEKCYCPGIGLVKDDFIELVCFGTVQTCPIPDEEPEE